MEFSAIARVGVELEGGWAASPANAAYHADGSVRGLAAPVVGEMVSAPMGAWADVAAWLDAAYPAEHNASCGMHVHVSFKARRDYARLMTPAFFAYFQARMRAWGQRVNLPASHLFWTRLGGFNHFCAARFLPDAQVAQRRKGGARYTQLNYCFRLHGTIECRLFPVFKQPKIAVSAVQELLSCYEDFLRDNAYTEHVAVVTGLA